MRQAELGAFVHEQLALDAGVFKRRQTDLDVPSPEVFVNRHPPMTNDARHASLRDLLVATAWKISAEPSANRSWFENFWCRLAWTSKTDGIWAIIMNLAEPAAITLNCPATGGEVVWHTTQRPRADRAVCKTTRAQMASTRSRNQS